jgi:DNA polymerase III subunit delta
MAKSRVKAKSIADLSDKIKKGELLPVYLLFGDDSFGIDSTMKALEETASKYIESEFDKETIHGEEKSLAEILDFASAFPFGGGKKLIIVKDFEKIKDKKNLTSYVNSPSDFTILLLINNGSISNIETEPFKSLRDKDYLFEARELRGRGFITWLIDYAGSMKKSLSEDNAQLMIDIVGEDKSLLKGQLDKIFIFIGDEKEITLDAIKSLSTVLKEYTIFDLQNALGKKNKKDVFNIAGSLLEKGTEPTFIIYMLTKYFSGLSKIDELKKSKIPDRDAAKFVGTHPYYYKDYISARSLYSDDDLYNAAKALLKADVSIKTTTIDKKAVIGLMLAEILN